MKARSKLHKHICMKCSTRTKHTVWEHDAPECFVPGVTAKNCQKCTGGDDDSSEHFRHKHYCSKHSHEWDHADKICLLNKKDEHGMPEVWTLDCPGGGPGKAGASASSESGGTAQMSRPKTATCPKCETQAQWIADASEFLGHDDFICPECGYEFFL